MSRGAVEGAFPRSVEYMNADDKTRLADGENDEGPPSPKDSGLPESDAVRKDRAYTPGSESETQHKQQRPIPETVDEDIDPDDVRVVPGTGGPDDVGDVDVDPDDVNLP